MHGWARGPERAAEGSSPWTPQALRAISSRSASRPAGRPLTPLSFLPCLTGNVPPVVANCSYTTLSGQNLTVAAPEGVLANASDPDGGVLAVTGYSQPASGSVTVAANGSFRYVPAAGFEGNVSFKFNVSDGQGGVTQGVATITVGELCLRFPCTGGGFACFHDGLRRQSGRLTRSS